MCCLCYWLTGLLWEDALGSFAFFFVCFALCIYNHSTFSLFLYFYLVLSTFVLLPFCLSFRHWYSLNNINVLKVPGWNLHLFFQLLDSYWFLLLVIDFHTCSNCTCLVWQVLGDYLRLTQRLMQQAYLEATQWKNWMRRLLKIME